MQGAITTDYHYMAITIINGLNRELSNVMFMLREDQFVRNIVLAYELGDMRQVAKPATKTSHGIDNDIPNFIYRSLLHNATF